MNGEVDGRVCSKCHMFNPIDEFPSYSGENYPRGDCRECKSSLKNTVKKLKRQTPKPTDHHCCPICKRTGEEIVKYQYKQKYPFCLDHCHSTNQFRGWICQKCNTSLGGFNDDIEILKNAIKYLRKHNGKNERQAS